MLGHLFCLGGCVYSTECMSTLVNTAVYGQHVRLCMWSFKSSYLAVYTHNEMYPHPQQIYLSFKYICKHETVPTYVQHDIATPLSELSQQLILIAVL